MISSCSVKNLGGTSVGVLLLLGFMLLVVVGAVLSIETGDLEGIVEGVAGTPVGALLVLGFMLLVVVGAVLSIETGDLEGMEEGVADGIAEGA